MSENIAMKAPFAFNLTFSDIILVLKYAGLVYWDRLFGTTRENKYLEYIFSNATEDDADDVLAKADIFSRDHRFTMNVGCDKAAIILNKLEEVKPKVVIELGTYLGYSAIFWGRVLKGIPGAHIYSFEISPLNAAIGTKIIEFAGLSDVITVIVGSFEGKIEATRKKYGFQHADFVFIDHAKERYLPDLQVMENIGLLKKGTVIAADNLGFPGNPIYKEYVFEANSDKYSSELHPCKLSYSEAIQDAVGITVVL